MSTASTLHVAVIGRALMLYGIELRFNCCDQFYQQEYTLHRQMEASQAQ